MIYLINYFIEIKLLYNKNVVPTEVSYKSSRSGFYLRTSSKSLKNIRLGTYNKSRKCFNSQLSESPYRMTIDTTNPTVIQLYKNALVLKK